ncbi:MAG: hypothetical protein ABR574_11955 [Cryomorphaceae bacterium]
MKLTLLILSLIAASISLHAQDLVVTNSGDSINCKILYQTDEMLKLKLYNEATETHLTTEIAMSEIADTKLNFYKVESKRMALQTRSGRVDTLERTDILSVPKVRIYGSYGYSYKLGKSSARTAEEERYEKDIRNGNRWGVGLDLFWNESSGIGLKFHQHRSDASLEVAIEYDPTTIEIYDARQDLTISQFSVLYRFRKFNWNNRNAFNMGVGLGVVSYRDGVDIFMPGAPQTVTEVAECIALELELSYDIGLSENLAFSIGAELSGGYFENSSLEFPDGTTEKVEYEDDNGISAGRFGLWGALVLRL